MIALEPKRTAWLFPGQGSQSLKMGADLAAAYPIARQIFTAADQILGLPLSRIAWEGPDSELNDTLNTQPALFVHSMAAWRLFEERLPGFQPAFVAGHSMGELSALAAARTLSLEAGLLLVRKRGELMKRAGQVSPGGMAAILGLDILLLEEVCAQASQPGEAVQVANDNCPGQVVISGSTPALERALNLAREKGARRAVTLAVSIAAHSELMRHAQAEFNQAVAATPMSDPTIPVIGNVSAKPLTRLAEARQDLQAQLTSRVRWTETIRGMTALGVDTFIEIGNGAVLCGLVKRIDPQARCFPCGTTQDLEQLFAPA